MKLLKKVVTLFAVALISASFVFFPKPTLKAQAVQITFSTWTKTLAYSSIYYMKSNKVNIYSSRYVEFTIYTSPNNDARFEVDTIYAGVRFYNAGGGVIDTVYLSDYKNPGDPDGDYFNTTGWNFFIDLDIKEVPTTATAMDIIVPMANYEYGVADFTGTWYDLWPSETKIVNYWWTNTEENTELWSTDTYGTIPNVYVPTSYPSYETGIFIHWLDINGEPYHFTLPTTSQEVDGVLNLYAYTVAEITILFYDGFDLVDTYSFGYFDSWQYYPDETDAPAVSRSGYTFVGWKTRLGEFYNFGRLPTSEELSLGTDFPLYATFVLEGLDGNPLDPNTPAAIESIATLLAGFGWYNYEALMFLLFVFLVVINGFLAWRLQPPAFVYMVVSLVITVMFMFMNLIPLYVTYPLVLLLITGLIVSLKEGAQA